MPSMVMFLQEINFNPPVLLQYTVTLLYPTTLVLFTPTMNTTDDSIISVVMVMVTLSVRLVRAWRKDWQVQCPEVQQIC